VKWLLRALLLVGLLLALITVYAPPAIEDSRNRVRPHASFAISPEAASLHDDLLIGDLHADSTLWARDLDRRGMIVEVGHSSEASVRDVPALTRRPLAAQLPS